MGICLKNTRGRTGAWIKFFFFIISLKSDECSFNIVFTITKGIGTSITCTLFHRRKMSMFLD